MTRRVYLYLVGSLVLVSLAGCGRGYFTAEREAWRAEASDWMLEPAPSPDGARLAVGTAAGEFLVARRPSGLATGPRPPPNCKSAS